MQSKEDRLVKLQGIMKTCFNWQYAFLNLCGEDLDDEDMEIIIENELLDQSIKWIQLNSNCLNFSPKSIRALIKALPQLNALELTTSQIIDQDILIDLSYLSKLSQLNISQSSLNPCIKFSKIIGLTWDYLYSLNLYCPDLGPHGYKNLIKCSMPRLHQLSVYMIRTPEFSHISKAQWPTLKILNLHRQKIPIHQLPAIMKVHWKLEELSIQQIKNYPSRNKNGNVPRSTFSIHPFGQSCKILADFEKERPLLPQPKKKKRGK